MAAKEEDALFNRELFKKNRRAVKKYLLWRDKINRELEEAEEPEEPETVNESFLEIDALTCK